MRHRYINSLLNSKRCSRCKSICLRSLQRVTCLFTISWRSIVECHIFQLNRGVCDLISATIDYISISHLRVYTVLLSQGLSWDRLFLIVHEIHGFDICLAYTILWLNVLVILIFIDIYLTFYCNGTRFSKSRIMNYFSLASWLHLFPFTIDTPHSLTPQPPNACRHPSNTVLTNAIGLMFRIKPYFSACD